VLQAAIAVCHAQARTAEDTDWRQIATLYDALVRLRPTPVVQLNRAVALGMAHGPQAGLDVVDALVTDPSLRDYHLLPAVRGDLLVRLGRDAEARREFERAADLTRNAAERAFLLRRAERLPAGDDAGPTLERAAAEFLSRADLGPQTVRSYGQTLRRLVRAVGGQLPLASLTADQVAQAFATAWGRAAARTWNRHRSAARSFGAWAGVGDLTAGVARRTEPPSRTPGLGAAQLDALWRLPGLPLRERTLWRLLHESGAGVRAVLSLNVEDLDLDDRRARVGGTWVGWRAATAALLPDLVAGRRRGPLFLADRRPAPARPPAPADLCPETGRGRLSYERAEYLFKRTTRALDPAGHGYTLRQLRPGRPSRRVPAASPTVRGSSFDHAGEP
jgi:integrase